MFEGGDVSLLSASTYTAAASAFVQAVVKLTRDHRLSPSITFRSFPMASVIIFACDVGRRNLLGSMGCLRTYRPHRGLEAKPVSLTVGAISSSSGDSRP